jgi:hypothetical protein
MVIKKTKKALCKLLIVTVLGLTISRFLIYKLYTYCDCCKANLVSND